MNLQRKHEPTASWLRQTAVCVGVLTVLLVAGCSDEERDPRPNIIWIVWDTVRADHLGLYGYDKPTTPFLDRWAADARVFDDCVSVSATTVPSHASMFTGLLPTEHGTDNIHNYLHDSFTTVAELLQADGYRTYLYAANPHISNDRNFNQGFDLAEQPWDPKYSQRAFEIVRSKIPPQDRSSELPAKLAASIKRASKTRRGTLNSWAIKASGQLAQNGVEDWLSASDQGKPFFVFLNYMEAHRPYIPAESYRLRMMTPEQVSRSYTVDRSWDAIWAYTFRLTEYTTEELDLTRATYDATLAELDDLLKNLLDALEARGELENTVVILTSDHGEHLGEHHMFDHQYSLFEPLIRVPLVVHAPGRLAAGRDRHPVTNLDLFATVLELAGTDAPANLNTRGVSLLSPVNDRVRIAEYPTPARGPFNSVRKKYPHWDSSRWDRSLRAVVDGQHKYIWASDGRHELYDIVADPRERLDLIQREQTVAGEVAGLHDSLVAGFNIHDAADDPDPPMPAHTQRHLVGMGYVDYGDEDDSQQTPDTTSKPSGQDRP